MKEYIKIDANENGMHVDIKASDEMMKMLLSNLIEHVSAEKSNFGKEFLLGEMTKQKLMQDGINHQHLTQDEINILFDEAKKVLEGYFGEGAFDYECDCASCQEEKMKNSDVGLTGLSKSNKDANYENR